MSSTTMTPTLPASREAVLSQVVVLGEPDSPGSGEVVSILQEQGIATRLVRPGNGSFQDGLGDAVDLFVVIGPGVPAQRRDVVAKARSQRIPVLFVSQPGEFEDPWLAESDDWLSAERVSHELSARANRLLKRRLADLTKSSLPTDAHFFALVVHDLRTPLNVIGLSLRMISQAIPAGDAELEEDLRFVDENFWQIERMLSQLSDYYRMFEGDGQLAPTEFSPKRLLDELLEARATKAGSKGSAKPVPILVDDRDCPAEVSLDPMRARTAIQYVLANANAAANGGTIRLTMRGQPDRWVIEASLDHAAPSSVKSITLSPVAFERLCGVAAERRGMDLSIAAKVSELFGGSARLEVEENRSTRVVLDWPARLAPC